MSTTTDIPGLDLREQIVRIDRAIAETQKFQAEAAKMTRERLLAPFGLMITSVGAGAALFAAAQVFLKWSGG